VPVHVLLPVLVISRSPTAGSGFVGVATTFTQSAMDKVPEFAGQVVADNK